jgi:hypothetical protein
MHYGKEKSCPATLTPDSSRVEMALGKVPFLPPIITNLWRNCKHEYGVSAVTKEKREGRSGR